MNADASAIYCSTVGNKFLLKSMDKLRNIQEKIQELEKGDFLNSPTPCDIINNQFGVVNNALMSPLIKY